MKSARLVLAALILASVGGSIISASASHCGTGTRSAHDQFGSCENASGTVLTECAAGTDVSTLATIIIVNTGNKTGAQACAGQGDTLPIRGRVGIYREGNNVSLFIDGDDGFNPAGAGGWQRYDIRGDDTSKLVCARRGTGGTWSTGANGSSTADAAVNHSVGTGGAGTCQ